MWLRRAPLLSPDVKARVIALTRGGGPATAAGLTAQGLTLAALLGDEELKASAAAGAAGAAGAAAATAARPLNPALSALRDQLLIRSFVAQLTAAATEGNSRTVSKVMKILKSQRAILTDDFPSRFVWLSDTQLSDRALFRTAVRAAPAGVKRVVMSEPHSGSGAAYIAFAGVEHAVKFLIAAQQMVRVTAAAMNADSVLHLFLPFRCVR